MIIDCSDSLFNIGNTQLLFIENRVHGNAILNRPLQSRVANKDDSRNLLTALFLKMKMKMKIFRKLMSLENLAPRLKMIQVEILLKLHIFAWTKRNPSTVTMHSHQR